MQMRDFYIAGPFFNDEQLHAVSKIEQLLRDFGFTYFSPRLEGGVLNNMDPETRAASLAKVFESNVEGMIWSRALIVLVDYKDTGTTWEHGFFYAFDLSQQLVQIPSGRALPAPIVTMSLQSKPANVMLSQASALHCQTFEELEIFLTELQGMRHYAGYPMRQIFHQVLPRVRLSRARQETSE